MKTFAKVKLAVAVLWASLAAGAEWVEVPGATPYFNSRCRVPLLGNAFDWLHHQHVVFVGDSVSRYTYLNFAYLVTQRRFAPHLQDGSIPSISDERTWSTWKSFYLNTTAIFDGMERCDCFRPEDSFTPHNTYENRYLRVEALNLSVSYLQLFGFNPMSYRTPVGFDSTGVLVADRYGHREANFSGHFSEALPKFFHFLPRASVVVVNSGAWDNLARSNNSEYFASLIRTVEESVALSNAHFVWRTTTAPFSADRTVRELLQGRPRWLVLNANDMVNQLRVRAPWLAWDGNVHVHSFVYEEIIRILFGRLVGACAGFDF
jgi:hypothetical protein